MESEWRRLIHVRWCVSAAGQWKPQRPFSSCLKECNTVNLSSQRECAWVRLCSGDQTGRVCHRLSCFPHRLVRSLQWFVRSVGTRFRTWCDVVLELLELLSVCVCSVKPSFSVWSALCGSVLFYCFSFFCGDTDFTVLVASHSGSVFDECCWWHYLNVLHCPVGLYCRWVVYRCCHRTVCLNLF